MQSSKEVIKADLGYDSLHDKRMPYKKVTKWDVMNKVKELPCKTSTKDENMYRSLSLSIQKLLGIKQDRPLKMISGKRVIERLSLFSHKECIGILLKGKWGGNVFWISSDTCCNGLYEWYIRFLHECEARVQKSNVSRVVGRCSMFHEKCETIATSFPL